MLNQRFGRWVVLEAAGSSRHGAKLWKCRCDCGTERVVLGFSLRRGNSKSCGCLLDDYNRNSQRGPNHPNWRGGRHIDKKGYVVLHRGPNRPKAKYEHIEVMEQHLGRGLYPNETVHHKNGIRHENDISNLELKVGNHGPGQSISDVVSWSVTILKRYAPELLK